MTPQGSSPAGAYLATEPIPKLLLKFSVPCVLSMLVSALYNIVDQIFIGQYVGYLGNAATNVVYPFTLIALSLALLIGDGSAARFSLSLGEGDQDTANRCIGNGIFMGVVLAAVLTVVGFIFKDPLLRLFGVTANSYTYASDYMGIILIGIPMFTVTIMTNSLIRADGSPRYSMISTMTGAVINLILDPIFIFTFSMGVKGAAIATVIGQAAACVISLLYLRRAKLFKLTRKTLRPDPRLCAKIAQLGTSGFIVQISVVIVSAVFNNLIGRYGPESVYGPDIPLAAIGVVMKVFGIMIAFVIGISLGGQPISGYNYGAGNFDRVRKTYRCIITANAVVGVCFLLAVQLAPKAIISIFGSGSELYDQYAVLCMRSLLCGCALCSVQKGSSVFLQAIGKPGKSIMLSLSRDIVFFIPALIILARIGGVELMPWAGPVGDVLAFIITIFVIAGEMRRLKRPALS